MEAHEKDARAAGNPVWVSASTLPNTTPERKAIPLASGVLDYFPAALAYVAKISKAGNDKHNPGQPLHHARGKSMDHADCIMRHLVDRGTIDPEDNLRHSGKIAWRALALLQEELEREEGAPLARAAKLPDNPQVPERPKMVDQASVLADWVWEVTKPQEPRRPAQTLPHTTEGCVL